MGTKRKHIRDGRYEIFDKFVDSVCWSYGMADGSSWSNIFWNLDKIIELSGFDLKDQRTVSKLKRQMKDRLETIGAQMMLYGFKDGLASKQIDKEVGRGLKEDRFWLNPQTDNADLKRVGHKWQIDSDLQKGFFSPRIKELDQLFGSYAEANSAIEAYVADHASQIKATKKFSDYAFDYQFVDGSHLLCAIFPIGNKETIKLNK